VEDNTCSGIPQIRAREHSGRYLVSLAGGIFACSGKKKEKGEGKERVEEVEEEGEKKGIQ